MKASRVVIVVGLVMGNALIGSAPAQDPKFEYVHGGHMEDVEFISTTRGWTVGDGGLVRYTTDGGAQWTTASTPTNPETWVQMNGVFVLDLGGGEYKVWAVGEGGVVLVSTDEFGQDFDDANPEARVRNKVGEGEPCEPDGQFAILHDIFMFDVDNGWVVGEDGVIQKTEDGGATWSDVGTPPAVMICGQDPYDAYDIHFFADSSYEKGIVAAEFGKIFTTDDGGDSWGIHQLTGEAPSVCPEPPEEGDNNLEFWSMAFTDPDDPETAIWVSGGIGSGKGYVFQRTADWEGTWSQLRCYYGLVPSLFLVQNVCSMNTMYSLVALDPSRRIVMAGYGGQLFDWLSGTANFDPCDCVIEQPSECASDSLMWVQQDTTPVLPQADPCTPRGAFFGSAGLGTGDLSISVGDFGRITRYDGSLNETEELGSKHFLRLHDGIFFNGDDGVVVGQRNTIYMTEDGGENWDLVEEFQEGSCFATDDYFNAVAFSDDGDHGVAIGNNGMVAYSSNGGTDWEQGSGLGSADMQDVKFVPGSTSVLFAVGFGGVVEKSTNGGASWTDVTPPGSEDLYGVSFVSADIGFVVGNLKKIYRTVSGGSSWTTPTINGGATENLRDVQAFMTGPTTMGVFVVGENGSVFEKLDTSSTFEQIDDDAGFPDEITQPLFDVEVLNGGDNVRIGSEFGGVVLFRDDGTWRRVNSATDVAVLKLSFPTADEVFAIGYSFFVSHYLDD